ncbi:band 7 protein [Pendulispora brunnea]|uniref:Band 7 protein n=1 Tax=Pendulispora brunnea TaxID=2905690 RepID=A0ABZ2K641_9BACT
MAEIRSYPFVRHFRADASSHILYFRRGRLRASGRGLAFWFLPLSSSIAEVPVDQREQAFLFHGRSADFQDVTAQGALTYRIENPEAVAEAVDFTIDLRRGAYLRDPLEKLSSTLANLAQRHAWDYIAGTPVRKVLAEGQAQIRERIEHALLGDARLKAMGLAVLSVAVLSVKPTPDTERAIEAPVRERILQEADEAAFARRAMAVEKERAIQENELQNRIEIAKRNEQLIAQEGQNERRKATERTEAARISAEGEAERSRILGLAQADELRAVEGAKVALEKARIAVYESLAPQIVLALAAQQVAGKLERITIEHLNVSPDLLASMVTSLVGATTRKLEEPRSP